MTDYNLLVSYQRNFGAAKQELLKLFEKFGDPEVLIEKSIARGIIGVRTKLNNREVIAKIRELYHENPLSFNFTLKYIPSDNWCNVELNLMKEIVKKLSSEIKPGERWCIDLEKRRYTEMHSEDIIKELAALIKEKVDLEKPDKIIRIDILGNKVAISLLKPKEIFSVTKPD